MATEIEWADESWNPIAAFDRETGKRGWFCVHKSAGCQHCYAESLNRFRGNHRFYRAQDAKHVDIRLDEAALVKPLAWRKPRRVFPCSMTDLFLDQHSDDVIAMVFAIAALASQHDFLVLTKRPDRAQALLSSDAFRELVDVYAGHYAMELTDPTDRRRDDLRATCPDIGGDDWPIPNVWLGTSVENQAAAVERIPVLLKTPAAVRWLSCEPLLGALDLRAIGNPNEPYVHCLSHGLIPDDGVRGIDWVVIGGESGHDARPCHLDWIRAIVRDCKDGGAKPFVKQLGRWILGDYVGFKYAIPERWYFEDGSSWMPGVIGEHNFVRPDAAIGFTLDNKKGGDWTEWPIDLRLREYPNVSAPVVPREASQ